MFKTWQDDVATMMAAFQQTIRFHPTTDISEQEKELHKTLIEEEVKELLIAIDNNDLVKIADGIANVLVVALGAACTYGIDIIPVLDEVHRSNMRKAEGPIDSNTGKRLKPSDWVAPDIATVLNQQIPDEDL